MNMTEQEYLDYMARHGLALDPTLTLRSPASGMAPESPEGILQGRLQQFATAAGWLFFHPHDSRKSTPGWPDVALCHPEGGPLFLWELKSASGQASPAQRRWLDALSKATRIETGLYRPADWPTLQALLVKR
jgi:hypothetical protein